MKRLILNACAAAVLSGTALAGPAEAAYDRHGYGPFTPAERNLIARSQHQLDAIRARAWADSHISLWERAKLRAAEVRHQAFVYRLRHN
jgi:hypothetical protein